MGTCLWCGQQAQKLNQIEVEVPREKGNIATIEVEVLRLCKTCQHELSDYDTNSWDVISK